MRDQKQELVQDVSGGRASSTKDLTERELQQLIDGLQGFVSVPKPKNKANEKRRRIIAIAHQMGWQLEDDNRRIILNKKGHPIADMKRIDAWCIKHGSFGKPLNGHSEKELSVLIRNLERVQLHQLKKKA